jgi:hypothetical protein
MNEIIKNLNLFLNNNFDVVVHNAQQTKFADVFILSKDINKDILIGIQCKDEKTPKRSYTYVEEIESFRC